MSSITFTMIKPDAIANGHAGAILDKIIKAGFQIKALKLVQLTAEKASVFYEVHKGKPFFEKLIRYITSGSVIAAVLEKENAVEDFRTLIGNTDPQKAAPGTIRALFAKSIDANAIHGSDSDSNARMECAFFFSELEKDN